MAELAVFSEATYDLFSADVELTVRSNKLDAGRGKLVLACSREHASASS
jgi:hypothetical protein